MEFEYCKMEIFLPPSHLEVLQKVLQKVDAKNVDRTIEAVKKVHPYEEPVINVIPIWRTSKCFQ